MGAETSSTPQNSLASLFMSNQPTQVGQAATLPPITAPQPLIGNVDLGAMSSKSPIAYTPAQTLPPAQNAPQAYNFGFGGGDTDNTRHPFAQGNFGAAGLGPGAYVQPKPTVIPASVGNQPSNASLIAAAINKQYGKR
jgi:hypothetical protein